MRAGPLAVEALRKGSEGGEEEGFGSALVEAMMPLRGALKQLLREWGSPPTLGALSKLSGAGRTICWQVFRIAQAEDLAAEARHAPTPASLKRLLAAGKSAGVSQATIQAVEESAGTFQRFMKRSAADRAAFESLVAGAVSEEGGGERILLSQRRAAYRASSHIWGMQIDLQAMVVMVKKPEKGEGLDQAIAMLRRGVRRLRPEAVVSFGALHTEPSGTEARSDLTAFDAKAEAEYGVPMIPEFCSQPMPPVERVSTPTGWSWYKLAGRAVGMQSSVDWAIGGVTRNAPLMEEGGRKLFHMSSASNKRPSGLYVGDLLIHRPTLGHVKPSFMLYESMEGDYSQGTAEMMQQFPVGAGPSGLGNAARAEMVQFPEYPKLLRYMAAKAGWALEEFDLYRVRVEYPAFGLMSRMFFYVT